jgi:hypothetical protein
VSCFCVVVVSEVVGEAEMLFDFVVVKYQTISTIAKHILAPLLVGVAVGLIVWYLTTTKSNNISASPTTSDTTTTQKHDTTLRK